MVVQAINAISGQAMEGNAIPHVVVVDPHFEHYAPLAASARLGKIDIHFRSSGADAIKFAGRQRVDAWLVAGELDDMSGNDFVELLRGKLGDISASPFDLPARVAIVADGGASLGTSEVREAMEAGADSVLKKPISFRDLEELLGVVSVERARASDARASKHSFITLPVGVGAAIVAIALLMMG